MTSLPYRIETLADVAAIESAADRFETPCGGGALVWHCWGDGAPVLLLHGGSGSWTHWVRNIAALVRGGRRVLAPDLPGFGESARPPSGQDADVLPGPVERGLAQLLGAQRCDLVGFSFGSIVASLLAAEQPQRVRRLVLVGAPALSAEPMASLGLRRWADLPAGEERDAVLRYNLRRMMLARDESVDELAVRLHEANLLRDRMMRRRLAGTDIVVRTLPRIACPVAGIWGADDLLYRGRTDVIRNALQHARKLHSLTLVPNSGHWVQYEDPAIVDRCLADVLA